MGWLRLHNTLGFPTLGDGSAVNALQNIQLLNDGRVLIQAWAAVGSRNALITLSPDAYGRYENPTYGSWCTLSAVHQAPCKLLRSDGKVVLHGSHYPGDSGAGLYRVYDPNTNTVSTAASGLSIDHPGRGGVSILDDGRFWSPYGNNSLYTAASGGLPINGGPTLGFDNSAESGLALLPDGTFQGLTMSTGVSSRAPAVSGQSSRISAYPITTFKPSYASVTVLEGSAPAGTGVCTQDFLTGKPEPSIDWAFPNGIWHWQTLHWLADINPEIGPNIYMPKIGKVVHLGGHAGVISGWSPSDKAGTFGVLATYQPDPSIVTSAGNRLPPLFSLTSPAPGSTAASAVSAGFITCTVLADTTLEALPTTALYCATQDGKYVAFRFTSRTGPVLTGSNAKDVVTAGTSITFSGVTVGFGAPTSSLLAAPMYSYAPTLSAGEGGCAILPSGDLIYPLGYQNVETGYPNSLASWVRWDGVSSTPTSTQGEYSAWVSGETPLGDVSYFIGYCLLPTGQLLVAAAGGVWLYTDDKAPDPAAKPVITRMPTVLDSGKSFTLVGRQLSGIHVGAHWGDDQSGVHNHPLFRLTDISSGLVFFCPTTDYSYRGIQPNRVSSCTVTVPTTVPGGLYDAQIITNGVASEKVRVRVVFGTIPGETIEVNPFTSGS